MAINNEDLESLNEQLRSLAEFMGQMVGQKAEEKELTEEQLAAQKGFIKDSSGNYKKIDTEYKKRTEAEKNRADLEKKVNDELDRQYTKTQQQHAKEEVVNLKREELFQKELKSISDVIKGSLDISDAQKRVIAEWKNSEAYLTAQRSDMFKKQAEAMGGIVTSNGNLLKNNGKLVNTTAELTKQQQKQLAELKISGAPGKAFGEKADRYKDTTNTLTDFSSKLKESASSSVGWTSTIQLAESAISGMAKGLTVFTSSIYKGERGATVTANALNELTKTVGDTMTGIGTAFAIFSFFMPGGAIVKGLKIVGGILGVLGGQLIKGYGELQKLGAEQNDRLIKSYNKLSASGLGAAKGLEGMIDSVHTLNFSASAEQIEKFNELLTSNSRELKLLGTTAGDGAANFAKVAGELSKSPIGEQLEKLGVTADEQREHTLKYMAQQTRMGMMQGKNQQDLIKGASAYIEELDKLAMLSGATRKQQEESRNAVMAEEELRAAMLQAELDGDTKRQKELAALANYAAFLRDSGDIRGSTGVTKYAAAGGPIDEGSAAAMITYGKGIQAALDGKPIAEVIKQGNESSKDILKQMAGAKSVGADISGLVTGKTGTMIDNTKMIDEAVKISELSGGKKSFDEALSELQKTRKVGDERLNATVEGNRMQQAAAQIMDKAAFQYNDAAKIHALATTKFKEAVDTFAKIAGAKPVAGGTNVNTTAPSTGSTPTTSTPVPTTAPAREARQTTQTNLETATATREKAEKASGRGSQEAIDARLAEAKARLEAEKARRAEETATRNAARGLPTSKPPTALPEQPKATVTPVTRSMSPTEVPAKPKDTATATPTAIPAQPKATATPTPTEVPAKPKDTATATPTAIPVKPKDTATPTPTAVPVKSKDTATPVTRSMSPTAVPVTAPITQQKQMGESSELSKVEKELNRFTKSNNMQHQSNKDYVANLESKRKQLLAVGGNVPEPTLPQDSTKTATVTATATKPDDVMRLIKFQGDALGDKTHFEALDPAVKDSFINMIAEYGKPVQINAAMRDVEEQQQMWDDAKPDPNNPNKRRNSQGNPVAPPGRSNHNYGRALDLNRNQVSELASTGLLTKYGFNTIPDDPPHIEMAKMGGVFDGPESGYPVMLHGKEAVVPENQLKAVKTLLENVTKENLSSELPTTITSPVANSTEPDNILLVDLYNIMDDKFSTMISILSSSNDVQAELLKHSRV